MRSVDKTQSRVVRYYSGTVETIVIQDDNQGKALFSVDDSPVLILVENGNGDICVADHAWKVVVVVNASDELQFMYQGNLTIQSKYTSFRPLHIASDFNSQILIIYYSNYSNDVVHLIDCEKHFQRYIEYPCIGSHKM